MAAPRERSAGPGCTTTGSPGWRRKGIEMPHPFGEHQGLNGTGCKTQALKESGQHKATERGGRQKAEEWSGKRKAVEFKALEALDSRSTGMAPSTATQRLAERPRLGTVGCTVPHTVLETNLVVEPAQQPHACGGAHKSTARLPTVRRKIP